MFVSRSALEKSVTRSSIVATGIRRRRILGGHPKPATYGHLKTGQRSVATFKTGQ
jgi:hypothetical protein